MTCRSGVLELRSGEHGIKFPYSETDEMASKYGLLLLLLASPLRFFMSLALFKRPWNRIYNLKFTPQWRWSYCVLQISKIIVGLVQSVLSIE
jgi:hypothetical protein